MFKSIGIYVVLPMLFPMLKGTNSRKTDVFWACSSLRAWDEPQKRAGFFMLLFCVSELISGNNLYSDLHAYPISMYLAVSACKLVCIMQFSPVFTL